MSCSDAGLEQIDGIICSMWSQVPKSPASSYLQVGVLVLVRSMSVDCEYVFSFGGCNYLLFVVVTIASTALTRHNPISTPKNKKQNRYLEVM